jgi:hypothetical protein
VVIPKGFPKSVGRVESQLLGFPYSVISMACFGNVRRKITITAKTRFGIGNHMSVLPTIRQALRSMLDVRIGDLATN